MLRNKSPLLIFLPLSLFLLFLFLLPFLSTGADAYPTAVVDTRTPEDLRSALAMSQMILSQQAQLFRELINATKANHRCCNAFKSDLSSDAFADVLCPNPFTRVMDECFHVSSNTLSWSNARHSCQGMGGDLATPTHLYALRSFIRENHGRKVRAVWVGGMDNGPDGGWKWLNGVPVNSAEWGRKEPNAKRAAERCLVVKQGSHPLLHDEPCRANLRYVCQYHLEFK